MLKRVSTEQLRILPDIPKHLTDILAQNQHLAPRFAERITQAVRKSFEHPDTCMRQITKDEIRDRFNLSYMALIGMYYDEKMSLIHSLDLLDTVLIDTLRMENEVQDITDGKDKARWGVKESQETSIANLSMDAAEDDAEDTEDTEVELNPPSNLILATS